MDAFHSGGNEQSHHMPSKGGGRLDFQAKLLDGAHFESD
jgi:hypothetical protein